MRHTKPVSDVKTLMPCTQSHGVSDLQEKQKQLEEVNQKVESMHMVEQWQLVHTSYRRVIAWQQVAHCICTARVHRTGEPSCPASTTPCPHLDQVAGLSTGACCAREHQAFPPYPVLQGSMVHARHTCLCGYSSTYHQRIRTFRTLTCSQALLTA